MNFAGGISSLLLSFSGAAAVFAAAPTTPDEQPVSGFNLPPIAELPATDLAKRCVSLSTAVLIYRQIMRSNPVHGKNNTAGEELNWVDGLDATILKTDAVRLEGAYDYVGDYMKLFGPVIVPSKINQLETIRADKATCLNEFGNGHE